MNENVKSGRGRWHVYLLLVFRLVPAQADGHEEEPEKDDEDGKPGCFHTAHAGHVAHGDGLAGKERLSRFFSDVNAEGHHKQADPYVLAVTSFPRWPGIHIMTAPVADEAKGNSNTSKRKLRHRGYRRQASLRGSTFSIRRSGISQIRAAVT